jgi:H+/Cl- antiporter ClcA
MLAEYKPRIAPLIVIGSVLEILSVTLASHNTALIVGMLGILLTGIGLWYWAMAKGHPSAGWFLLAFVPFYAGLVIVALLPDKHKDEVPKGIKDAPSEGTNEAEPLTKCPHCGAPYRESDYNPDAREILCGKCRGVLPRQGS